MGVKDTEIDFDMFRCNLKTVVPVSGQELKIEKNTTQYGYHFPSLMGH